MVDFVRQQGNAPIYHIMLILTDGAIHDDKLTTDLICQAASLPMSIIIIGVGDADFGMMETLDGDDEPLRDAQGRICQRDIVQFVKFKECMARGNLAEEVLKEIPEQVCKFMESINFRPQAVQADQSIYAVQAQPSAATQIIGHHLGQAVTQAAVANAMQGAMGGLLQGGMQQPPPQQQPQQ